MYLDQPKLWSRTVQCGKLSDNIVGIVVLQGLPYSVPHGCSVDCRLGGSDNIFISLFLFRRCPILDFPHSPIGGGVGGVVLVSRCQDYGEVGLWQRCLTRQWRRHVAAGGRGVDSCNDWYVLPWSVL